METIKKPYRYMRKRMRLYLKVNWIKSLYFNFKMLPFAQARHLPILFYGPVSFGKLTGTIELPKLCKMGLVGFGQPYELVTKTRRAAELHLEGCITFRGYAQIGIDYFVHVGQNASLEMGNMSSIASNGKVICHHYISLGDYARVGSEAQLIDTNFHQMIHTKTRERYPMHGPIRLGSYNYISNRVTVLQGTKTGDHCTVASNTLCTKDYSDWGQNILIGGVPAQKLKTDIARDWASEQELMERYLILY
ncbi:MAG: transferase [Flavobacteriaceae bacterium]|nr:transferase [Flavobacteriaceae bacterium]MDG1962994.1 transferase [Flavobacteriaceae bacterium]